MATDIFANVATTGTNAYKSIVQKGSHQRSLYLIVPTGTLTGTMKRQLNYLSEEAYEVAVAAASGSTRQEKEAANDTGWVDQSFLQSDRTNASATFAINGTATFTADMPPCKLRSRCVFTNATNTGNMKVFHSYLAD